MAVTTQTLDRLTREDRRAAAPPDDGAVLAQARARFQQAQDAEYEERSQQYEALQFRSGKHWPEHLLALRSAPGQEQPCLVVPRQESYISQVINAYRKNPLSMRVRPKSGGASKEVGDILEGKMREIEQESEADIAYTTALSQAVGQGEGFFRLRLDYEAYDSFQQCVKIVPVFNRYAVYCDPMATHPAGLDLEWAFLVSRLSHDTFCQKYEVSPADVGLWQGLGDTDWVSKDEVQVAEYYYRTWETVTIVRLPDGTVLETEDDEDLDPTWPTRPTRKPTIWGVTLCGYAVLERTRWPGKYIPLIRVEGQRLDVEGRARRTGMVQASRDSQFAYDTYVSAEQIAIALAPKAPYLLAAEQIAGYEAYWNQANDAHMPYLPYKHVVINGTLLPPPQRQQAEPQIQAITQARLGAAADIQASLGLFEASLGAPSNEQSGAAVQQRRVGGEQTNFTYTANLSWSLRACGIQIVDLLPTLYSGPTSLRQVAPDGEVKETPVNQPPVNAQGQPQDENLLARGQYDVVMSSGPAYETQRIETSEKLGTMLAAIPHVAPYALDMWASSLDFPGSQELAQRFKTLVPPQALEASDQAKPETQLVHVQNQLRQAAEQLQQVTQQLQHSKQIEQVATQQLALLEQAVAKKDTQLADKSRDLAVDVQQAKWDYEVKLKDLALKERELALKYQQALADQALEQEKMQLSSMKHGQES